MKSYNNPDQKTLKRLCARTEIESTSLDATIKAIFEQVRWAGDEALLSYTQKFDDVSLESCEISMKEARATARKTPKELKQAIKAAAKNIQTFHESQIQQVKRIETAPGVVCWQEPRSIKTVGLYVPGGSAPLMSTVLMLGVPARIAGCQEIVLCTPPNKDSTVDSAICYAALLVGVTKIIRIGGAQAVAALSIGTESVPKVDKIFGPGNQYVTAAKIYAQNFGVAIDMPAGPSEVMVIADKFARPQFVAADLLSQAEHGPDSQAVLISTDEHMVKKVNQEVERQLKVLPRQKIARKAIDRSFCIVFNRLESAFGFADAYAPEHLILNVRKPESYIGNIRNTGSVFIGQYTPESAGDYASGTNHTLPTGGWARSYGGISLDSFVKKVTFQSITEAGLRSLAPTITTLATAEGLEGHARSISIRFDN